MKIRIKYCGKFWIVCVKIMMSYCRVCFRYSVKFSWRRSSIHHWGQFSQHLPSVRRWSRYWKYSFILCDTQTMQLWIVQSYPMMLGNVQHLTPIWPLDCFSVILWLEYSFEYSQYRLMIEVALDSLTYSKRHTTPCLTSRAVSSIKI